MSEIEDLREENKMLKHYCQVCSELLSGMMKAAGQDNPELMEMDFYTKGIKQFEEMSMHLREMKGEA